jgi:hypothetical protein
VDIAGFIGIGDRILEHSHDRRAQVFNTNGGCGSRRANDNASMDRKGAQELATILIKRHGVVPETAPAAALTATNASPIFHWFGIEPPAPNETDAK